MALVLGLVIVVLGPVGHGSPAALAIDPSRGTPGPCPTDSGVTVVVDFQGLGSHGGHGGGVIVRCAPGSGMTGLDALHAAGFEVTGTTRWGQGFVCRLEGRPAADEALPISGNDGYTEPCVDTPPAQAFWSYWHADNGGPWTFSQFGGKNRVAPEGSFEGWSFSLNASASSNPAPRFTPERAAAPAPGDPGGPGGGSGGGSGDEGSGGSGSGGSGGAGGGSDSGSGGDGSGSNGSGSSAGSGTGSSEGAGGSAGGAGQDDGPAGSSDGTTAGQGGNDAGEGSGGAGDGSGADSDSADSDAAATAEAAPPLPRQGLPQQGGDEAGQSAGPDSDEALSTATAPEEHPGWSGGEDAAAPSEDGPAVGLPLGVLATLGTLVLLALVAVLATRRRRSSA